MDRVNVVRCRFTTILIVLLCCVPILQGKQGSSQKAASVEEVNDVKELKKLLRTKNNVLICFISSMRQAASVVKVFRESAELIRGQGTMVIVDCSGDARKMCKKLKVNPEPFTLKHYKDGEFHKEYDRLHTVQSMVSFMRDPTGDVPWEEDSTSEDVVHIPDTLALQRLIHKKDAPQQLMVLFYAPWCGFCKNLKPEYAAAATELKGHSVLAAIDVNRPENAVLRQQFNISGFPTLIYFENGNQMFVYEGENTRSGLVSFMKNPEQPPEKPREPDWAQSDSSVVHLNGDNFDSILKGEASALVMFYAPWCGHCKKMKPEYEKAAEKMKLENIPGILAAVDATREQEIASRFGVKGYPTMKYFRFGETAFDAGSIRETGRIIDFMKDPKEPPPPPPPDRPWSEEEGSEVVHLTDETFKPFLRKKRHVLVMFYAPWCGHCKKTKPEFVRAAEKFRDDPKVEFAAVDCTQYSSICSAFEVKGYPTIKYFHYLNKETKNYNGGRTEPDFVSFMKDPLNPRAGMIPQQKAETSEWGTFPGAEFIKHLTEENFDNVIKSNLPTLVMFYAPWCGHCRKMKPDFSLAAQRIQDEKVSAVLAAVDATLNPKLQDRFQISGFPTLKLFKSGLLLKEYEGPRTADSFISYLRSVIHDEL